MATISPTSSKPHVLSAPRASTAPTTKTMASCPMRLSHAMQAPTAQRGQRKSPTVASSTTCLSREPHHLWTVSHASQDSLATPSLTHRLQRYQETNVLKASIALLVVSRFSAQWVLIALYSPRLTSSVPLAPSMTIPSRSIILLVISAPRTSTVDNAA